MVSSSRFPVSRSFISSSLRQLCTPLFLLPAQWLQNEGLNRSGSRLVLCYQRKCFLSRLQLQAIKVDTANLWVSLKDHGDGGQASEQDSDCHPANIHQSPSRTSMRSGVCPSSQPSYLGAVQLRRTWRTEAGVPAERPVIPRTYTADWIISELKDAQCMSQAQSGNAALTTSRVPAQSFSRASPGLLTDPAPWSGAGQSCAAQPAVRRIQPEGGRP